MFVLAIEPSVPSRQREYRNPKLAHIIREYRVTGAQGVTSGTQLSRSEIGGPWPARAKEVQVRLLTVALWVLLALVFLGSAAQKLTGGLEPERIHLGIEPWFWTVTALVELVGVLGLVASLRYPKLAAPAGLWIAGLMVGAIVARLGAGDPPRDMIVEAVLLTFAVAVALLGRRSWKRAK